MKESAKKVRPGRNVTTRRGSRTAGWREGNVREFLGLSDEEAVVVRTKAALAVYLRRCRNAKRWSQALLAERLGSGQSRVAKMEAGHPSVSFDLLVKALLETGATMDEIGAVMATGDPDVGGGQRRPTAKKVKRARRPHGAKRA
jgi:hypothetical protein